MHKIHSEHGIVFKIGPLKSSTKAAFLGMLIFHGPSRLQDEGF
jgi:hypothetical protein